MGPFWPGAIAPWKSKILDLRYLTRVDEHQFLTLGFGGEAIQVYEPSGETQEVTIKVELVFDEIM